MKLYSESNNCDITQQEERTLKESNNKGVVPSLWLPKTI